MIDPVDVSLARYLAINSIEHAQSTIQRSVKRPRFLDGLDLLQPTVPTYTIP
jgi:hypothetical protein